VIDQHRLAGKNCWHFLSLVVRPKCSEITGKFQDNIYFNYFFGQLIWCACLK